MAQAETFVQKTSNKNLKVLQIFEVLFPLRPQETIEQEYSDSIKKVVEERK